MLALRQNATFGERRVGAVESWRGGGYSPNGTTSTRETAQSPIQRGGPVRYSPAFGALFPGREYVLVDDNRVYSRAGYPDLGLLVQGIARYFAINFKLRTYPRPGFSPKNLAISTIERHSRSKARAIASASRLFSAFIESFKEFRL